MEKKSVNITACFPARENSARHVAAIWKLRAEIKHLNKTPIDRIFPLGSGSARHNRSLCGRAQKALCVWLTRLVLKVLQTLASLDHLGDVLLHDVDHLVDLRLHPGDRRGPIGRNSRQAGVITWAFIRVSYDICLQFVRAEKYLQNWNTFFPLICN